jgi:hypothetical protein
MNTETIIEILFIAFLFYYFFNPKKTKPKITITQDFFISQMEQLHLFKVFYGTFTGKFNNKKTTIRKIFNKGIISYKIIMKYKLNKESFLISKETVISKIKKTIGIEDLLTGDNNFDSKVLLRANNPQFLLAVLDFHLRKLILNIEKYSDALEITNSKTTVYISESNTQKIKYIVNQIDQISTRLKIMQNSKINNLILDKIKIDPDAGVRALSIRMIRTEIINNDDDNEIRMTLKNALNDESFEVQLEAAMSLGKIGADHFIKTLQSRKNIPSDQSIKIIEFFSNRKYYSALPVLSELLENSNEKKIQIIILKAFPILGDTSISDQLVTMLKFKEPDILLHVVEALEFCGNLHAVEPIYKIGMSTNNSRIKISIQKTIAGIQARQGNGEKGWLSVSKSAEKEGALSITDIAPEGSLSIKESDEI